jgi:phenylacetate-CoA ligase
MEPVSVRLLELLHRRALIPAFESGWHRRSTLRRLEELEISEWLSLKELQERQLRAARAVVAHAYEHCPYYREGWRGLDLPASGPESLEDFSRWPVIERETITENRERMKAQGGKWKLIKKATGGSSGVPLQFYLDEASNDAKMAASHRGYGWAGAGLGTKQFYLWGGAITAQSVLKRCKEALYHKIYRRKVLSSFRMSEEHVGWYLNQLNRHRPGAMVAYVNPLYEFARMLEERKLVPFSPRTIVVGAEKLHDFQRELIERVFRTQVFETYGSREFMLLAAECSEHAGMHVTMENVVIEVVDEEGRPTPDGEVGDVVVTDLTNYGMPLIRYRNGDRAVAGWQMCKCGRGLPLLRGVVGRRLDMLRTADGRVVPGEFFPHLLKDFAAVRRFQVVQERFDKVCLKVVVSSDWTEADKAQIEAASQDVLGPSVTFGVEAVTNIPLTAAGKQRVVVSFAGQSVSDQLVSCDR